MVVLLIVAIIAAASAPMVTKKLSRSAGTNDSPWVFTGLNNNIAYLGDNSGQVLIGAANRPASADHAMLYIAGRNNWEHIAFGNSNNTDSMGITANPGQRSIGINRINNNLAIPQTSVMFGMNQTLNANNYSGIVAIGDSTINGGIESVAIGLGADAGDTATVAVGRSSDAAGLRSIAVGQRAVAAGDYSIAIGSSARASGQRSIAIGAAHQLAGASASQTAVNVSSTDGIAIGPCAYVSGSRSIALGRGAWVNANENNQTNTQINDAIAIGNRSTAMAGNSIAIGSNASTLMNNSVAIGAGARADQANQIVLGTKEDTVYIPGRLVVGGHVALGINSGASVNMRFNNNNSRWYGEIGCDNDSQAYKHQWNETSGAVSYSSSKIFSDRRLKNVGEKYAAGLNELKKLDFFHFTFKQDEEKTPHVGVMAQDLEKVFPDAVTKGEDGYLRIRWDDMFYAVINAVKELDNKISEIVQNITDINSIIERQNKTIEEQQKTINELVKRIEKLEKQK